MADYEFWRLSFPRSVGRAAVSKILTDQAEYGGWELDRVRVFSDGSRRVVLRRRIIRVLRTL
jgi:hypothetical protein